MKLNLSHRGLEAFDAEGTSKLASAAIELLDVSENSIVRMSNLHLLRCLIRLDVRNNRLTALPELPPAIRELAARDNLLVDISSVGIAASLEWIDVSNNNLETLPRFQRSVRTLIAAGNAITSLENAPPLVCVLDVSKNCISSIHRLPESIRHLGLQGNPCMNDQRLSLALVTNFPRLVTLDGRDVSSIRAAATRSRAPRRSLSVVPPAENVDPEVQALLLRIRTLQGLLDAEEAQLGKLTNQAAIARRNLAAVRTTDAELDLDLATTASNLSTWKVRNESLVEALRCIEAR